MDDLERIEDRINDLITNYPTPTLTNAIANQVPADAALLDEELPTVYTDNLLMDPLELSVNTNAQREIDPKNLEKLLTHPFEWKRFGALVVIRRRDSDGNIYYSVVDGQHRIACAILKGITRLPVTIYDNPTNDPTVEPTLFKELNSGQPIDKIDIHNVLVQVGDPDAIGLQKIVDDHFVYFHQKNSRTKVNHMGIKKIQYLLDIQNHYGNWDELLTRAFDIYMASFTNQKCSIEADLIKHIALFLHRADKFRPGYWTDISLEAFLKAHKFNRSKNSYDEGTKGKLFYDAVRKVCKEEYDTDTGKYKEYWFTNWLADNFLDASDTRFAELRALDSSDARRVYFALKQNPDMMKQLLAAGE